MPQLDKVTFLSQFFWLCFFYLGFYLILLKYFLPKMSRILKLRKKKMSISQEGVSHVQQENLKVRTNYETVLFKGLNISRNAFNNSFNHTMNWLEKIVKNTNQTHFQRTNQIYIHSIGQNSLSQNLALSQSSIDVSSKLFLLVLISKMKSLTQPKSKIADQKLISKKQIQSSTSENTKLDTNSKKNKKK